MSESTRPIPSPEGGAGDRWADALAQHEGLVHWVVRRQGRGPLSYADALHEGRIGLWQALRHYDPTRGTQFSTYAVPAIAHALWGAVAAAHPVRPAQAPRTRAPEVLADPVEEIHGAQVRAALRHVVASLPPRLRHVVAAHAGLAGAPPQTFAALGQELGCSRQRVHQLYGEALAALAHPSRSLPLRHLLDRATRADYQQTLARLSIAGRSIPPMFTLV